MSFSKQLAFPSIMQPTNSHSLSLLLITITTLLITDGALLPLQGSHGGAGGEGSCIPSERAALLSFKRGIISDPIGFLSSWHGRDCCQWRGVTCNNRTGHVLRLHLRNPNNLDDSHYEDTCLFSEISSSLLALKHLEHLDLSMNCLGGLNNHIPEFLGSIKNLRYLNLSSIPFTGRVPPQIGNLTKLQYLDLGDSRGGMHSADINWLTNLQMLQYLSMSTIDLSGISDWPQKLNMVPSLRAIDFSGCKLYRANQSLPYLNLTKLEWLDISSNSFDNTIASSWFWKATSLKHLNLRNGPCYGQFYNAMGNMTLLQVLDLSYNYIGSLMTTENFKNLFSLEILDLTGTYMNGDITILMEKLHLCAWDKLQELHLRDNNFTGTLPDFIGHFSSLKLLDLGINNLDGAIPLGLGNCTCLNMLDLSSNHLSGAVPREIGALTNVIYMDLSSNKLSGTIPTEIGVLTSLTYMDLSSNNLNGTLPIEICALANLSHMDLSSNHLSGHVPYEIGALTSLTYMDLSSNKLSGTIPTEIGVLTSLTYMDLSSNNLNGTLPIEICALANLSHMDLSSNHLSGHVPYEIGALTNVTYLGLNNNNLNGSITEQHLSGLISLKHLDLSSNSLNVELDAHWFPRFRLEVALFASCQMGPLFPAWLQWQSEITRLDISRTKLEDSLPDWFWSTFSKAMYIDISRNQISGRLPAHLGNMTVTELNISSNRLTGPIPKLPQGIVKLDFSSNSFSGTLPSNLEAPELKVLLMFSNQIHGSIPESICQLKYLNDLDFSSNFLEGQIPQCLETEDISFLLLSNNSLSGKFPTFLHKNSGLVFLDLAWNMLSGRLPTWIGELSQLRFLRLSHNRFSGSIPVEIMNLESLNFLDLSGNSLSGVIPWNLSNLKGMIFSSVWNAEISQEFHTNFTGISSIPAGTGVKSLVPMPYRRGCQRISQCGGGDGDLGSQYDEILLIITKGQQLRYGIGLENFVSIDLSDNTLSGEIPTGITSLDAIINLNLSSNQLTGKMPEKLGALQSLESLDLSKNKLFGGIPSSLSNLTALSFLNLSYNNLSGRIPSGRQLDTLNADNPSTMYIGNSELCGPPLQKNCSGNESFIHENHKSDTKELELMTFYVGLAMGLVVGLWIVFCALLLKKTWRIAYFKLFDKLYDRIYVLMVVKWASLIWNAVAE
ncbi:hypothetical protein ACP4OV_010419 [Aristida adscensionis]